MSLPFMRLYPQDYLQDTNHLTTEEHGAYLLLIFNYWQTEKPLPDDDKRLAGICKADAKQWLSIRSTIEELFDVSDGVWHHKRIDSELLHVTLKSEQAKRAGRIGGLKRADNKGKTSERLADAKRPSSDTDTDTDTDTHITPTSSPTVSDPVPYKKIVNLYHKELPNHPRVKILTPARKSVIKQRHIQDMDSSLDEWESYFGLVKRSAFLTGKVQPANGRKVFIADLEWITKQGNFAKIFEGKYHGE